MSSEMTHHTAVIARVVLVFDQTDANTHVYEETNKMLADAWDNLVHIPGYSRTGGHLDVDLPNRQASISCEILPDEQAGRCGSTR